MRTERANCGAVELLSNTFASFCAQTKILPWPIREKSIVRKMWSDSDLEIEARAAAINYVKGAKPPVRPGGKAGPIWQFWGQGAEHAPPLVQTCFRSIEKHAGDRKRVVLNVDTIHDYLDIPGHIMDRIPFWGWTKFSNLLRLTLLDKHGGTWIDSTVLIDHAIPAWIEGRDFFVFRWDHNPRIIATWFMHSTSAHPLVASIRDAYENYWMMAKSPGDYFMFHYIVEALVLSDRELARLWMQLPFHDALQSHELQSMLLQPYNDNQFRSILDRSWIQKLTYKVDNQCGEVPTYLSTLTSSLADFSNGMTGTQLR